MRRGLLAMILDLPYPRIMQEADVERKSRHCRAMVCGPCHASPPLAFFGSLFFGGVTEWVAQPGKAQNHAAFGAAFPRTLLP